MMNALADHQSPRYHPMHGTALWESDSHAFIPILRRVYAVFSQFQMMFCRGWGLLRPERLFPFEIEPL